MCLLSVYKPYVMPKIEELMEGIDSNQDGSGFTIATASGQLITEHAIGIQTCYASSYKDKDGIERETVRTVIDTTPQEELAARFVMLRGRHPEGPAMFHSRFATGGTEDTRGCHPYQVGGNKQTVLAHNGVMFTVPYGDWRSDTRIFAEDILPARFRKFWKPAVFQKMETYLNRSNKVAIITTDRRQMSRVRGTVPRNITSELFIFNESAGVYTPEGAWHSNNGYLPSLYSRKDYDWSSGGGWLWDNEEATGTTTWTYDSNGDCVTGSGKGIKCEFCMAYNAVDPVTEICAFCFTCQPCAMLENECECYTPRNATVPASIPKAITSGIQPGYNLSPDEVRAEFLSRTYRQYETNDNGLMWPQYLALAEAEVRPPVTATDDDEISWPDYLATRNAQRDYAAEKQAVRSARQLEDADAWSAEQAAMAAQRGDSDDRWMDTLATEADPEDDGDNPPGIIRRIR